MPICAVDVDQLLISITLSAKRTTAATVFAQMPRDWQYLEVNQTSSVFAPLLELHEVQHLTMFSGVMTVMSLTMCSHVARDFTSPLAEENTQLQ